MKKNDYYTTAITNICEHALIGNNPDDWKQLLLKTIESSEK